MGARRREAKGIGSAWFRGWPEIQLFYKRITMFLHYWGVGATEALARGLKAALDQTKQP
jgi:hypothetical protein